MSTHPIPEGETTASARVHQQGKTRKHRKANDQPWTLQGIQIQQGWTGLHKGATSITVDPESAARHRSDWGAIRDRQLWKRLYQCNAQNGGWTEKVGNWLSYEQAIDTLDAAINAKLPDVVETRHPRGRPHDDLVGMELDRRTAWDEAAGSHVPKAGCATDYESDLFPETLRAPYAPGEAHGHQLLPIVLKPREADEKDTEALDTIFSGYLAAGAIVEWTADMGLPTVVTPVSVVWQGLPGKMKPRVIVDYRYVNGAVPVSPLTLPSVLDIVRATSAEDGLAKEDLKTGYHQLRMRQQVRHLCATIWRGKLFAFTCMTFGLRDAPGQFQRRTEYVAGYLTRKLGIKLSEAYLDDFIQICTADQYEQVLTTIAKFGFVMGLRKCAAPATIQDVLGLRIDTKKMLLIAPPEKVEALRELLKA